MRGALWVFGVLALTACPLLSRAEPADVEAPAYKYKGGEEFRDPFLPLTGAGMVLTVGPSSSEPAGAFNPSSIDLKGILKTGTGRWAVLRGSAGETYLVQNGKIFDRKRKPVDGYVGVIKEKSLVIIGPNNQMTELKLKKGQEE